MHVANVQYSEAVKRRRQLLEHDVVALDANAFCIPACSPVETGQLQCVSNDRMDRIPVLYVKEEETLAEDLRLVVRLDLQTLSCVYRPETFLQFAQDIFVHGITFSVTARSSMLLDSTAYSDETGLPDTCRIRRVVQIRENPNMGRDAPLLFVQHEANKVRVRPPSLS